jgi:hypothetical protein
MEKRYPDDDRKVQNHLGYKTGDKLPTPSGEFEAWNIQGDGILPTSQRRRL